MAELTVPTVDFSALGQLPQIYQQGRTDAIRKQTLANLGQGGTADATALLKSGDLSLAQLGINMKNHEDALRQQAEERARQAARDKVSDSHWAASYELQKRAAARADEGPVEQAGYRAQVIQKYGIDPNSTEGRSFILTGKLPERDMFSSSPAPQPAQNSFPAPLPNAASPPVAVPAQPQAASGGQAVPAWAQPPQALGAQPAPVVSSAPNVDAIDEKTGRRDGYLKTLDPRVQDYIKKIADYEIDPRTTSVKGGERERLMSAVAKYDPSYNQNEFGARAKAMKDFSTGTQGNIIRSFDVAIDHLDTLQRAATAMQNGDVRVLNQIRNEWRNQTGSDLPTNFQALVPLVSGEIAKAVIGSNNALSDREELRHNLQAANSPSQIAGVITGYKGLMSGQLKGLRKQYESTTGKKDFDSKLREHTLKELSASDKAAPVTIDGYTIKEN